MNYYGAKDLAAAFRTVRKNTLIVAEEIPEDKYSYRAAEGTKTVGEMLTHIALGPKFFNVNLTLVKRFAVTEGSAIDLRLEAFNAFNTVNFSNPALTLGAANFGSIISAGDPRQIQVAVRYRF